MKNQKGFIQIQMFLTIIVGVLVVSSGLYLGINQYKNYRAEKVEKDRVAQEEKRLDEKERKKIQELVDAQKIELNEQKQVLEKQSKEIEKIKIKPSIVIQNIEQKPSTSITDISRADLIEQWTPNVAQITCSFDFDKTYNDTSIKDYLKGYGVDTRPIVKSGSGFLQLNNSEHGQAVVLFTNQHVLRAYNGFAVPYFCEATLPGSHTYSFTIEDIFLPDGKELGFKSEQKFFNGIPYWIHGIDSAWLWIRNPDYYTRELATPKKICESEPRIGEEVIILGYPGVGSVKGITATEGIIAGIEDFYYVTSAKVEQGNSGGVAILRNKNCYLGIPTFAIKGQIESLARILKLKAIFK